MATFRPITYKGAETPPWRDPDSGDTMDPALLPIAVTGTAGAMSVADKAKLDAIEDNATADQSAADVPFTPTGTIAATNVQDAIAEVAAEAGSGSGNVASSGTTTDNRLARFQGPTGTIIEEASGVSINDNSDIAGLRNVTLTGTVDGRDVAADGAALDAHTAAAGPHSGHEVTSAKGATGGYASLDGAGTVPLAQIPVLGSSKLAADSVGASQIAAGAVGTSELAGSIPLTKMASQATQTILGAQTVGSPVALTATQTRTILNVEDNSQENRAENLGIGGQDVFKQASAGTLQFRRLGGGTTTINVGTDGDNITFGLAASSIGTTELKSNSVGFPQMKDIASGTMIGRASSGTGDPEALSSASVLSLLGISGAIAAGPAGTVKGVEVGGSAITDVNATELRRIINVHPASGALAVISKPRIQRIRRTGKWIAGDAPITGVLDTHGTNGHSYPFMAFTAVDFYGHPHRDHDRLASGGGPTLVTAVTLQNSGVGTARFVHTTGTWPSTYSMGNWIESAEFGGANDGYWYITARSGANLDVLDPLDVVSDDTGGEVRGTSVNSSRFNGYEEGLFVPADSLRYEDRVSFYGAGFLENDAADNFVEFVLEPNPVAGTHAGTRMLSGELGATWAGEKPFQWWCSFYRGYDVDEYFIDWRMRADGVLDIEGGAHVTGGVNLKTTDVVLSPRFRVDGIDNIDTYGDDTYQGGALRLEMQRYEAGAVE